MCGDAVPLLLVAALLLGPRCTLGAADIARFIRALEACDLLAVEEMQHTCVKEAYEAWEIGASIPKSNRRGESATAGPDPLEFPVTVLSSEKHTGRRAHMELLLSGIGFTNFSFIEPVSDEFAPFKWPAHASNSKAQRSHVASYLQILQTCHSAYCFVMEDDIAPLNEASGPELAMKIRRAFSAQMQHFDDVDMMYLEFCYERCGLMDEVTLELRRMVSPMCTAAIMFSQSGVRKILANSTSFFLLYSNSSGGMDNYFARAIRTGQLHAVGQVISIELRVYLLISFCVCTLPALNVHLNMPFTSCCYISSLNGSRQLVVLAPRVVLAPGVVLAPPSSFGTPE